MRWPLSALRVHLWEDCIPKSFHMACFPLFPQSELLIHTEKHFPPLPPAILMSTNQGKKMEARVKEAMSDLFELNSYVSAHGVNNVLLWYDPSPLTLTPPPVWPPPDSQHSEVTQEVINQTQWEQRYTSPNCFNNELCCWVASCVCRCLLTLTHTTTKKRKKKRKKTFE